MGGEISVWSEPGAGTTFVVRLPAQVEHPRAAKQPSAPAQASATAGPDDDSIGSAGRVLVIDDDANAREVIQRMLHKENFRVIHAPSGPEGLRLAREQRPDVITLDVMMPGMDGWAVLGALKADPDLTEIPVVMLTMVNDRNLGYALGAADYLTKPVNRERLTDVLGKLLSNPSAGPVLVVEDDASTREMLRRTLEREGCRVVEAANGREALDRVAEARPALILLDLMMPEVDGFVFVDELRSRADGREIPIVVLTAKDLTEQERQQLHGRVQNILQKGAHSREALLDEVRRLRKLASPAAAPPTEAV
jgi:CheY-like chemotaxis protein